jgi:hypothetical protein
MEKWRPSESINSTSALDANVLVVYYHSATAIKSNGTEPSEDDTLTEAKVVYEQKLHKEPQRIRINSEVLVKELTVISEDATIRTPLIMVPPFKLLVVKATELATSLEAKKLAFERKHGHDTSSTPTNNDALLRPLTKEQSKLEEERLEKETERRREKVLIDHLQVLLDFMNRELGQEIERRKKIINGEFKQLAFEHLWHLFNPGDIVFITKKAGGEDYDRAHRIYHVTGGRRAITCRDDGLKDDGGGKAREEAGGKEYKMGMTNKLYLDCTSTGFDGEQYFPVGENYSIKPYEGERDILELPIYPLRCRPDYEGILQALLERGKKFRALDRVSHRYYDGLTTKDIEEIHGEVIVDFKTGYRSGEQDEIVTAELGIGAPEFEETQEGAGCTIPGCTICKSPNYDDTMFDYARYIRYFRANTQELFQTLSAEHDVISDSMLQMLPRDVLAYELRSRKWRKYTLQ